MKSKYLLIALLSLAAVLLLTAAAPLVRDQVRLTVDNQSDQAAYLRLEGDNFYYLTNPAGIESVWTPDSGQYSYMLYTCGHRLFGKLDLSKNHKLVVPSCGNKALRNDKQGKTDVGQELKLIRVWFENVEHGTFIMILRGQNSEGEYVFSLPADVYKEYTIPKGSYDYTLYACGKISTGVLNVYHGRGWEMECP